MPGPQNDFSPSSEIEYYLTDSARPVTSEQLDILEKDMQLWIPNLPERFHNKDILDFGAGKGAAGILVTRNFQPKRVVSVELVFSRLHAATHWAKQLANYRLVVGNVFSLPFADCSFDYIVANSVLHHLPNLQLVTREIQRVLRPGGMYIGREPNFNNPLVRWGVFRLHGTLFFSGTHSPNEYPLRAKEIVSAFQQAGCRCDLEYFWRRMPGLCHPLLSAAMSVQAKRL